MLKDYEKVLMVLERINNYTIKKYNKALYEIDKDKYRSVLDRLFYESDYINDYNTCKLRLLENYGDSKRIDEQVRKFYKENMNGIDTSNTIENMSDNDLMNYINCTKTAQLENLLIIRYDEVRIYNNKAIGRNVYDIYEGVLRECRSIVIDIREFKIVSLPFYKFMSIDECEEYSRSNILKRLNNAKIIEYSDKIDGSFIQITKLKEKYSYYEYNELLTSSKNIIDGEVVDDARKWYDNHINYRELINEYPDYTVIFEWVSMNDKHIVKYEKEDCGLWLIGMRHKESGKLLNYHEVVEIANRFQVKHTEIYDINYNLANESLSKFKCSEKEGYVINIDGFLVKMKCSDYLDMVNILKENGHENAVIRAVSDNRIDELMMVLPDAYHSRVNETLDIIYDFIEKTSTLVTDLSQYAISNKDVDVEVMNKWLKGLPKVVRGTVKKLYYNNIKGFKNPDIDYLRGNHFRLENNYINMAELNKRKKIIDSLDINKYKTL